MRDFRVTITNPARAAEWQSHLGTTTVCVRSPVPTFASLPGYPHALVYMLDLDCLEAEQKERLIAWLAEKFELTLDEVRADLESTGVPIRADGCVVMVENPQRWL